MSNNSENEIAVKSYKYLVYSIDKHQSTPTFKNEVSEVEYQNADDGYDVIVDLETQQRYFRGSWHQVDCK